MSFDVWCSHCMFGVEIEVRFRLGRNFRPDSAHWLDWFSAMLLIRFILSFILVITPPETPYFEKRDPI
jgi:hypothetical protein